VKQHGITDCAAASIVTICLQYGKEVSVAKIREIAGQTGLVQRHMGL